MDESFPKQVPNMQITSNSGAPNVPQTPTHQQQQQQQHEFAVHCQQLSSSPLYGGVHGRLGSYGASMFYGTPAPQFHRNTPVPSTPTPTPAPAPTQRNSTPHAEQATNYHTDDEGRRRSPQRPSTVESEEPTTKRKRTANKKSTAKGTGPRKGKGSKSGANARQGGASEEEMDGISEDVKAKAGITIKRTSSLFDRQEEIQMLEYILEPKRWANLRVQHQEVFTYISQEMFKNKDKKVTFEQCQRWYFRQWNLYCAVRARDKHTGGGDGDDYKMKILEGGDEDDEDDPANVKDEEQPSDKKRARGGSKYFSAERLNRFRDSVLFEMFDNVAHDHPSVVKRYEISSDKPIEDIDETAKSSRKRKREDSEDMDNVLSSTMQTMTADQDRRYLLHSEQVRLETERGKREAEEAERKKTMHLEELRERKWAAYHESLKYADDEFARRRTAKLKRELEELEDF